jgi:dTDP-4-amino-4,6-dideoxygalactose transaminase
MAATKTTVPLLNLTRQFAPMREEILAEIAKVFDSQKFILGDNVSAFETEIAAYLGAPHAVGVSSGTDALLAALMALGIGPGDEVVVPAFSFFATAGVVSRLGAVPVFADIERDIFNLSAESFESKITPRTRAVVPVHLYGQCARMEPIHAVAGDRGIAVVEDACQAIGATIGTSWGRGRFAGTLGAIGAYSFFPTKNLGASGDAGLVTTPDAAVASRLRDLRVHGMNPKYFHSEIGGNFRLDELQAAVLRVKLRRLEGWSEARRAVAARYRELLAPSAASGKVVLPAEAEGNRHVYHQFVVRVARRDEVRRRMAEAGVGTEVYYPVPLHLQKCFAPLGGRPGDLPESERAAAEVLALPVWPELEPEEIEAVASALAAAVE